MAERVKKRSEIREQDTWKLEDMIASPEKFEELADGVEERIPAYETYRGKLGSSADLLKSYLEFDESMDEDDLSPLCACDAETRSDTSVSENQALCPESSLCGKSNGCFVLRPAGDPGDPG